jgi:hypothetical protein
VDFALFILVAAILFIRPLDFIPSLASIPLYLIAIVPCIFLSLPKILPQLTAVGCRRNPVLAFGLGLMAMFVLTSAAYRQFELGFNFCIKLGKILIFYVLLSAQLDSPARLKLFVRCLAGILLIPISLSAAHYHGLVNIAVLNDMTVEGYLDKTRGAEVQVKRLGTTGNFGDPNEACELINCGAFFSLCALLDRGGGCTRVFWLAPLAVFGHALGLTHSRGGFLAAVVGLLVLFRGRFRGIKSLALAGMALALMFVFFAGRQTSLSTSEGTGQGRIQLWNRGFSLWTRSPAAPVIGLGIGRIQEETNHVAHNAFVQTYVELGFIGGTMLFGQYYWCLTNLAKLNSKTVHLPNINMRRLGPFMFAALASFATSEMTLTNPIAPVSYTMFGLATACIRLANPIPPLPDLELSQRLVRRIAWFSALFLSGLFVFVKLTIRA